MSPVSENLSVEVVAARVNAVREQIAAAADNVGRNPGDVRLVVVTKGHPAEAVRPVVAAGVRLLGENYVEEAVGKIAALGEVADVEWHMIGHVQSRKAQPAAAHFAWLHSLDSLKLAQRLDRFAGEQGRRLPVLLECNVSGEESKFGWPAWDEAHLPALVTQAAALADLPNLEVRGLMTMAPYYDDPEAARPCFRRLKNLQQTLAERLPQMDFYELSMGMSGDFQAAVQEGATIVRIGTAIMGARGG